MIIYTIVYKLASDNKKRVTTIKGWTAKDAVERLVKKLGNGQFVILDLHEKEWVKK